CGGTGTTTVVLDTGLNISSFGEDAAGELYVADLNGAIYRIATPPSSEIIIDNAPPGVSDASRAFTGTWVRSAATDFFGADSLAADPSAQGAATYRWTPTLAAGTYDVFVWWTTH